MPDNLLCTQPILKSNKQVLTFKIKYGDKLICFSHCVFISSSLCTEYASKMKQEIRLFI